jgi:hypothetical protein
VARPRSGPRRSVLCDVYTPARIGLVCGAGDAGGRSPVVGSGHYLDAEHGVKVANTGHNYPVDPEVCLSKCTSWGLKYPTNRAGRHG